MQDTGYPSPWERHSPEWCSSQSDALLPELAGLSRFLRSGSCRTDPRLPTGGGRGPLFVRRTLLKVARQEIPISRIQRCITPYYKINYGHSVSDNSRDIRAKVRRILVPS